MERERNNTGLVVAVTILAMLVLGLTGFIVYDKVINKTNEPNIEDNDNLNDENNNDNQSDNNDQTSEEKEEIKEISIKDKLVTSLKFPTQEKENYPWHYKNVSVNTMSRDEKMIMVPINFEPVSDCYDWETKEVKCFDEDGSGIQEGGLYSASTIERKFKQLFGPDADYYNGNVNDGSCCTISIYNEKSNTYLLPCGCGGGDPVAYFTKKYKAEQSENYIYVYEYAVKPYFPYDDEDVVILYNSNGDLIQIIDYKNYESKIYELMDEGKIETYKWTFKKQSDGKYYFYSGAWEN